MSTSDDEFTDELEQDEEIEGEVVDDEVEAQADDEEGGATVVAAKVDPTLDEEAQLRTVSSRDQVRQQLEDEIKRFLSGGGHIEQLAADDTQKA
jgi:hypothetical protein